MYVAVRRYEGVTDPKEAGGVGGWGFLATIHENPGFRGLYLGGARGRGMGFARDLCN